MGKLHFGSQRRVKCPSYQCSPMFITQLCNEILEMCACCTPFLHKTQDYVFQIAWVKMVDLRHIATTLLLDKKLLIEHTIHANVYNQYHN